MASGEEKRPIIHPPDNNNNSLFIGFKHIFITIKALLRSVILF